MTAILLADEARTYPFSLRKGMLVLVEVHGLPDNLVKEFTYRTSYPVQIGQLVSVPAPDWSIRVTGRAELPGFVLGVADHEPPPGNTLRDICPIPAVATDHGPEVREAFAALAEKWRKEGRDLLAEAEELADSGLELMARATDIENAIDGTLGF